MAHILMKIDDVAISGTYPGAKYGTSDVSTMLFGHLMRQNEISNVHHYQLKVREKI